MKTFTFKMLPSLFLIVALTFFIYSCEEKSNTIIVGEFSLADYADKLVPHIEWDISDEKITNEHLAVDAAKKVLNDPYKKDGLWDKISWEVLYDSEEDVWLIRKHVNSKSTSIIVDSDGMLLTTTF